MSFPKQSSPPSRNHDLPVRLALVALALLGFFSVLLATRWGAGTSPDSISYFAGARNLATGRGFSTISVSGEAQAITHHAPFYSAILALLDMIGLDPMHGARVLNSMLFAGNILLVGFILLALLPGKSVGERLAPVFGAGLILLPGFMIEIHSMAWSESLFLFLTLLGFWILSQSLENQTLGYLVGSAVLIALAFLTRYVGIVLVASGVISILLFSTGSLRHRLFDMVLFGLISAGPMAFWLLRNSLIGETATNREFLFHPIHHEQIGLALTTLGSWFLVPDNSKGIIKIIPYLVILSVVAVVFISKYRQSDRRNCWVSWVTLTEFPVFIRIGLIFTPVYFAFLLVSLTFLDANTPLDTRILSPVYVIGVILVIYFLFEGVKLLQTPAIIRIVLTGVSIFFMAALFGKSFQYIQSGYTEGIGFTNLRWRESPTLVALTNYPANELIYTNAPEVLYLYTQHPSQDMPRKFESANQQPNDKYDEELLEIKKQIFSKGGLIVYFNSMIRPALPSDQEIQGLLGLQVLEQTADGLIYGIKQ